MPVEIVTASRAMRRAVEVAERVATAPQTSTILVFGETGTGKDLVARHIHERSGAMGAYVTIDCAALPETLVESELFGHVRGAFTGASESRAGRLEAARGGTLVLDEVAALSLSAQAKLLRVLDERRFTRLGGIRAIDLSSRVVALTNIDLEEATRAGTFRHDLYYRLNVVTISLPPLREQREAIAPLAERFVRLFAPRRPRLAPETVRVLEAYPFPGNVRELRNAIEHAVIRGAGDVVEPSDLPTSILRGAERPPASRPTLAELEADYVRTVLAETHGNKAQAARILGISRKNLYERLRRMTE